MRHKWLIALLIALLPAMTLADRDRGGRRHDRHDRHDRGSRSYFDVSIGYGARYGDFGYSRFSYGSPTYRGERYYGRSYYCPPPVIVYPAPQPYYSPPVRSYYFYDSYYGW